MVLDDQDQKTKFIGAIVPQCNIDDVDHTKNSQYSHPNSDQIESAKNK